MSDWKAMGWLVVAYVVFFVLYHGFTSVFYFEAYGLR